MCAGVRSTHFTNVKCVALTPAHKEDGSMQQKHHVIISGLIILTMLFFLAPSDSRGQQESEKILPLNEEITQEVLTLEESVVPEDQAEKR